MFSQLAKEDLDDIRAEGLMPTDADVIRLHALGARISDGGETTAYNAPRFAVAGGVVFWEPTLAARSWYAFAKTFADDEAAEEMMFAFACANGRKRGYLETLLDPEDIQRELGKFIGGLTATKEEITNAVYFAAVGHDEDARPELTDIAKERLKGETRDERERRNFAALEEVIAHAAAATGLTFDDIMCQTPSRLRGMIYAAHVQAGMEMTKANGRASVDYLATLAAIRKRLEAERDQAAADSPPPPETD